MVKIKPETIPVIEFFSMIIQPGYGMQIDRNGIGQKLDLSPVFLGDDQWRINFGDLLQEFEYVLSFN